MMSASRLTRQGHPRTASTDPDGVTGSSRPSSSDRRPRHGLHVQHGGYDAAITEWSRLTGRDHQVIALLGAHRAMTADQLAKIVFPRPQRARGRLLTLTERGVLARAREHAPVGSRPWVYCVGPVGAIIHALRTGGEVPTASQTTTRIARLLHSRSLPHLLGCNEFFAELLAHSRTDPTTRLDRWEPERVASGWTGGLVRPDAYGQWTADGDTVRFFLEHDRGTEPLPTLLDKIDKYGALSGTALALPVLLDLPTTARERNVHRAIQRRYGPAGPPAPLATRARVPIRPGTATPDHPAGAVWRVPAPHSAPENLRPLAALRSLIPD